MIRVIKIYNNESDRLLQKFDETMTFVKNLDSPIKLNNYGYFLRLALNLIQEQDFDYLLHRLKNNKDLERNEGGYSLEYLSENNPKKALCDFIGYLKDNLPKTYKIRELLFDDKCAIIVDQNDYEYLKKNGIRRLFTLKEAVAKIKNQSLNHYTKFYFYTFNGQKDFNFLYHLPFNVFLVLYNSEAALYEKQLQSYKHKLEEELTSYDRFKICGIKYEPILEPPVKVSSTLETIIKRLDERPQTAYNGYINESDSLLDELGDKTQYEITFTNRESVILDSNDAVFDVKGNLVKTRYLVNGSIIRIYPKEELGENLMQIAIDSEPAIYGKVQEHADFWQNVLKALDTKYPNRELLYKKLKNEGLKVLPNTVDAYFKGHRKYPMFNSDLRAILSLGHQENMFEPIKKSKRLYNSTTIALGRGLKQELKQFLHDKALGDILIKRNFSAQTLSRFIEERMPLLKIADIKEKGAEYEL